MTVWFILLAWFGLSALAVPFLGHLFKPHPPPTASSVASGESDADRRD